jgi:hypothetical protein
MRPRVLITSASFGSPLPDNIIQQESNTLEITISRISDNSAKLTTTGLTESVAQADRINAMHPRLRAKMPKMLQWSDFPGYDYYIWVDSKLRMDNPKAAESLVKACSDKDACFFRHSARNSIRLELEHVIDHLNNGSQYIIDRYAGEDIAGQVSSYLADPNFVDHSLFECGAFVYSSRVVQNPDLNLFKEWFYHNCIWSVQDQLSLPYLLQKFGVKYGILEGTVYKNKYLNIQD